MAFPVPVRVWQDISHGLYPFPRPPAIGKSSDHGSVPMVVVRNGMEKIRFDIFNGVHRTETGEKIQHIPTGPG